MTHAPDLDVVRSGGGMKLQPADDGTLGTLTGRFSEFGRWYRVSSKMEGDFLERVAPGATADTIRDHRDSMRVLFDHGMDAQIGNKVLGPIDTLEEKSDGPHYEVPLFDTQLQPGSAAGPEGGGVRRVDADAGHRRRVGRPPGPVRREPGRPPGADHHGDEGAGVRPGDVPREPRRDVRGPVRHRRVLLPAAEGRRPRVRGRGAGRRPAAHRLHRVGRRAERPRR